MQMRILKRITNREEPVGNQWIFDGGFNTRENIYRKVQDIEEVFQYRENEHAEWKDVEIAEETVEVVNES